MKRWEHVTFLGSAMQLYLFSCEGKYTVEIKSINADAIQSCHLLWSLIRLSPEVGFGFCAQYETRRPHGSQ